MSSERKAAFATLLTRDTYLAGTLVLEKSLRDVKTKYPFIVMVTSSLPQKGRDLLVKRGLRTIDIEHVVLQESRLPPSFLAHDSRFVECWSKLGVFGLEEFDRLVLLDSDMIVRRNMDELIELELPGNDYIAAAHVCACNPRKLEHYPIDWIPENCAHTAAKGPTEPPAPAGDPTKPRPWSQLNSGLVVLNPSKQLARDLVDFLLASDKVAEYTFADQDVLIAFFEGKWISLHWYYNALKTLRSIHPTLWKDEEVRCVHYILADKPWTARPPKTGEEGPYDVVNRWWWDGFERVGEEMRTSDPEGWTFVVSTVAKEV